uniref:Twisted gastrulation BMP signaling modulator 1 n=1 Tax=Salvator merianae TaxID=96440 RepID=A0A8D0E5B1_SALMN
MRLWYSTVPVLIMLLAFFWIPSSICCNKALCASDVSKCLIQELCQCRPSEGNCSCCKECMLCLGTLWDECCDCVGMCNPRNYSDTPPTSKSTVEELHGPIPSLFRALTEGETHLHWNTVSFPVTEELSHHENLVSILETANQPQHQNVSIPNNNVHVPYTSDRVTIQIEKGGQKERDKYIFPIQIFVFLSTQCSICTQKKNACVQWCILMSACQCISARVLVNLWVHPNIGGSTMLAVNVLDQSASTMEVKLSWLTLWPSISPTASVSWMELIFVSFPLLTKAETSSTKRAISLFYCKRRRILRVTSGTVNQVSLEKCMMHMSLEALSCTQQWKPAG